MTQLLPRSASFCLWVLSKAKDTKPHGDFSLFCKESLAVNSTTASSSRKHKQSIKTFFNIIQMIIHNFPFTFIISFSYILNVFYSLFVILWEFFGCALHFFLGCARLFIVWCTKLVWHINVLINRHKWSHALCELLSLFFFFPFLVI